MGKIDSGINGPVRGKVGTVVGAVWKDIAYVRSRPSKPKNRTEGQLQLQSRFSLITGWLKPFKPFTALGLMNYSGRMTAYNAAYSLNHSLYPESPEQIAEIDYSRMILSDGSLKQAENVDLELIEDHSLQLTWSSPFSAADTDELLLLLYSAELGESDHLKGGVLRRDGRCLFRYTEQFKGMQVAIFIGFVSRDRKKASRSQYLGKISI
ncbi:hypothetical protein GS399_20425 [Pedobacter sp. HMF7647]|uniref:Uncharacterized protein n=1 Tax=Hufsiella arboris TaxID=2695275 RepID=A0A7K1YFF5_9SPHI|nr:DUF6266 family protein [Hufsiella arboris]MXV53333.1 hypothetical protein [Hufsiella arboris]